MLMLMDNSVSPAPPPIQPSGGGQNPYDFITNPGNQPKKNLFGGNLKARLMVVAGLAVILLIIGIVVASILGSSSSELKSEYQSLVQQQAEIIRVSEIGAEKARSSDSKNLAVNTQLSLTSSQGDLLKLASKSGATTNPKIIALGKDSNTDNELTKAEQTNRFDEAFAVKITQLLAEYQKTIKSIYDRTTSESAKSTLNQAYNNSATLMQNGTP